MMDSDIAQARGHKYNEVTLYSPSICTACHTFIFGAYKQGLKCANCQNVVHHNCKKSVKINCYKMFPPPKNLHEFAPKTFYSPAFCDQCGSLIFGLYKQGIQCKAESCKLVAHHRCKPFIGSSCGTIPHVEPSIFQKLLGVSFIAIGVGVAFTIYKLKN